MGFRSQEYVLPFPFFPGTDPAEKGRMGGGEQPAEAGGFLPWYRLPQDILPGLFLQVSPWP